MRAVVLSCFLCCAIAAGASEPVNLRLLTSEKIPFNYMENQQVSGISIDMLRLLFDGKLPAEVELMPWPRAYATALEQKNVMIFTMGRTEARNAAGFQFVGPVSRRFHALYAVRTDLPPIHSFSDIHKHRLVVAGLRAGWLSEQFKNAGINIETVVSYQQGMDMLLKDRAQLWLSTDLEEQVLQAQHPDAPNLVAVWRVMCSENFFGFSPGTDPALVLQFQQKYQQVLRSKQATAVQQKWQSKLALPLAFSARAGFYLNSADILACTPTTQAG